jgi:hypothetical protein
MQITLRARILIAAAIATTAYVIAGPSEEPVAGTTRESEPATRVRHAPAKHSQHLDTSRILALLAHRVTADTPSGSLFASHSWYTPPPPPPPAPAPVLTQAQEAALRAPVAPPLPFAFMGSYSRAGAEPVYFLTKGDRIYDVKVGDVLDDTYSLDSFSNGQLVLTYKPLQIQQQLTIGSAQ